MRREQLEFVADPELNSAINTAIEKFHAGPAIGSGPAIGDIRSTFDGADSSGMLITRVSNFADDQYIKLYEEPRTGTLTYFIWGDGVPESLRDKQFRKHDDQTPLSVVDLPGTEEFAELAGIEQTASEEESRGFLELLENVIQVYEKTSKTDLLGPTNAKMRKALTVDLFATSHPKVHIRENDNHTLSTVSIDDDNLEAELRCHTSRTGTDLSTAPRYYLTLRGEDVPEKIHGKEIILDFEGGKHAIESVTRGKKRRWLRSTPEQEGGVLGILEEQDAQSILQLLAPYMQEEATTATPS